MYQTFYKLRQEPFTITPDPRFLFLTEQHQTALNALQFAIGQRKGFTMLTGEVGTGKTTLCRTLLERLPPACRTALILNPMLSPTQLLRAVVEEFGLEYRGRDRLGCLRALNAFLLQVSEAGGDAVLIIDEAQDMPVETLEMTRLLSNLETASHKLLQIVLAGQPELRQRVAGASLRQLAQRITVRYHLGPMDQQQTGRYLRHRLSLAGGDPAVIDDSAVEEIFLHSGGTPRLINALADRSLLAGYVLGAARVDRQVVRSAVEDLQEAA